MNKQPLDLDTLYREEVLGNFKGASMIGTIARASEEGKVLYSIIHSLRMRIEDLENALGRLEDQINEKEE